MREEPERDENELTLRSFERRVGFDAFDDCEGVLVGAMNIEDLERGGLEDIVERVRTEAVI